MGFLATILALALTFFGGDLPYRVAVPVAFDGYHQAPLDDPPPEKIESLKDQMFERINAERANEGLPSYSRRYDSIAQTRSDDMVARGYFGHTTPEGAQGYVVAIYQAGYVDFYWAGENLARYSERPNLVNEVMAGLMGSPLHRANIMEPYVFDSVGIGVTRHPDGTVYFAQIFASGMR